MFVIEQKHLKKITSEFEFEPEVNTWTWSMWFAFLPHTGSHCVSQFKYNFCKKKKKRNLIS